jgi:hypothetical protein
LAPADDSQRGRCYGLYIGPTVVTCLEILTQYPGPWYRDNALGSGVERAWVSVDSEWERQWARGEREQRILVEGALCAWSSARLASTALSATSSACRSATGAAAEAWWSTVGGLPPGCGGYSVTIARRMLSLAARRAGLMAVTTPAMAARMTTATRVR